MKKPILIFMVLVMGLMLCSCSIIKNKIINTIRNAVSEDTLAPVGTDGEQVITSEPTDEPENTAEADVDSGFTNDVNPTDIPGYVPAFSFGKFDSQYASKVEYEGTLTFSFQYQGVTSDDLKEYAQALEDAGFENYSAESDGYHTLVGTMKIDDKKSASVMLSLDGAGLCIYSIIEYETQN